MMYIEHKHKDDLFWIMRLSDKDKEEYIESISYAIDKCIKEEYREKFNKEIISIFKNAEHNEKYDKTDEQSVIILSSQITSLLLYLLLLLSITADRSQKDDELIEIYKERVEIFRERAEIYKERAEIFRERANLYEEFVAESKKELMNAWADLCKNEAEESTE